MRIERGVEAVVRDLNSVLTVGTFDGVHLGHRAILDRLLHRAGETGLRATVVSFDPHPRHVLADHRVHLLSTIEERARVFESLGVDRYVVLKFDLELSQMAPEEFVRTILVETVGCKEIVVGYDHGFGRNRAGNFGLLDRLGPSLGFDVTRVEEARVDQDRLSSTVIRQLIEEDGDVEEAERRLGRPYGLTGVVVKGDGRGRGIGFPTANIGEVDSAKVIPLPGVYAVWVTIDGMVPRHGGMMNIGVRPTFGGTDQRIEVHLIAFDEDLYGARLQVEFVKRLRDEQKFDSVDGLIQQLSLDKVRCTGALEVNG